jgi:transcriptional regulator with XRE-family HTH domain
MKTALTFGQKLANERKIKNLTLAEAAKGIGISEASLCSCETDEPAKKKTPNYLTFAKIADFYEVTYDYLLDKSGERKKVNTEFVNHGSCQESNLESNHGLSQSSKENTGTRNHYLPFDLVIEED